MDNTQRGILALPCRLPPFVLASQCLVLVSLDVRVIELHVLYTNRFALARGGLSRRFPPEARARVKKERTNPRTQSTGRAIIFLIFSPHLC